MEQDIQTLKDLQLYLLYEYLQKKYNNSPMVLFHNSLDERMRLAESDSQGLEHITLQGIGGHQLAVRNIQVGTAANELRSLNGQFSQGIPKDVEDRLSQKYKMYAIVDGHAVTKTISQNDYDRFLAANADERFKMFNEVFGVRQGNSVELSWRRADDAQREGWDLFALPDRRMELDAGRDEAMNIVRNSELYQRATQKGMQLNVTPTRIGQFRDGSCVLQLDINGEKEMLSISQDEYERLVLANGGEPNFLQRQASTVIRKTVAEIEQEEQQQAAELSNQTALTVAKEGEVNGKKARNLASFNFESEYERIQQEEQQQQQQQHMGY